MLKAHSIPARRHDIDWVRVLGMLMVFLFHCARFFDQEDWHAKNNQLSFGMTVFVGVVSQWIMPLFFVLSGMSSCYALSYLRAGRYLWARVKRLVVPLMFGIFTQIPLQVYIERVSHGQFSGSFFEFFPHYFDGFYGFGGNFAWMGLHLWYLEMLFIFSLLLLPFFLWLRKDATRRRTSGAVAFLNKPGGIFLLALPLALMEILGNLQPDGIGVRAWGGWNILSHMSFFVSGYVLATDAQFRPTLERHRMSALAMGVIATSVGYLLIQSGFSSYEYSFSFLRAFNSWCWLVAILGFGSRHLDFDNRALKYANEAVLPFYILHQTVIVTIGFFIADWDAGVMVKYLLLSMSSFIIIIAVYDLTVRRVNMLRFLFGMKMKKRQVTIAQSVPSMPA